MASKYAMVKKFYDEGRWGKKEVRDAVEAGWITPAQYEQITGEPYEAE